MEGNNHDIISWYYPNTYLERLRETMRNLSKESCRLGCDVSVTYIKLTSNNEQQSST